jgi:putative methionine-R-sulfoxide reductase with GAF domain
MNRPYDTIEGSLHELSGDRVARMQAVVEVLWEALNPTGVSWVGFYVHEGGEQLVLGPRRDKPACSPIGLHGACGQAFRARKPLLVHDVADLGEDYIACDPRDRSEVILPLVDETGTCWGVLDLDSYDVGAFDDRDVTGLQRILVTAGLMPPRPQAP